jgi:hypothetical protein
MFGIVLTASVASRAPAGPQWPDVALDEPQWPNIRLDDIDAPRLNQRPTFVDPQDVEDRIMSRKRKAAPKPSLVSKPDLVPSPAAAATGLDANASVAARWPALPPEKQPWPFVFEGGARYWFSSGSMKFGFTNGSPYFGNPTSTLDWQRLTAHTGEVFARIDHMPSGVFVKGLVGGGSIKDGHIVDRDFFVTQFKFSDTTSDVSNGNSRFAMFDVGWAYSPLPNMRLGFFVGYHYWHEKVTANGILCNIASTLGCPSINAVVTGFDTPVLSYEPTWHAVRIGAESKLWVNDRWSFSGEFAVIPYAVMQNKDSHLLRQDFADLGTAPNIVTKSKYAYGVEAELFVNYAVTPNIEIGAGVRYWGLASRMGDVRFGPEFDTTNKLTNFDQERYGVLLHAKGRF